MTTTTIATITNPDPVVHAITCYRDTWIAMNADASRCDDTDAGKDRFYKCEQRHEDAREAVEAVAGAVSRGEMAVSSEGDRAAVGLLSSERDSLWEGLLIYPGMREATLIFVEERLRAYTRLS